MELKTFYSLINQHVIEVPIIQREYAQGRTTDRVTTIRKRFVKDLIKCIHKKEKMHLGFIYGKIEGKDKQLTKQLNRNAVNSILQAVKAYADTLELQIDSNIKENSNKLTQHTQLKFIPLDGQQRLTTLYVLHWYLYLKGATTSEKYWIYNFNYTNRKSTMDFLKVINEQRNFKAIQDRLTKDIKIKSIITKASFYLAKWNKDKTVRGILEMLQAIENELGEYKDFDCTEVKLNDLKFQFDFMDLDDLNQTNELYVKMNSRGKQLTNYEHFKSWLQNQYRREVDKEWLDKFWRNLDNKWLNFFWCRINADFNKLDDFYFNFLKNLALMHTIAINQNIPFESFKELIGLIRNSNTYDSKKISYISFEKFYITFTEIEFNREKGKNIKKEKKLFLFNKKTLEFIENTFNTLQDLANNKDNHDFLDQVICKPFVEKNITDFYIDNSHFTPTQPHAVFYYAFIAVLNKNKAQNNKSTNIEQWLRFIRNLIYNTNIQNPDNFYNALQQTGYLLRNQDGFKDKVLNNEIKNSFFDNTQFEEEILKLELINKDDFWHNQIVACENQYYFQGQIKFLIDFSKQDSNEHSLQAFIKYSNKAIDLFSKDVRCSTKKVLQRALLAEGDYLPHYKSNYSFCLDTAGGLRTRNENWRLFFKGENVILLKQLIEKIDKIEVTENSLKNYIEKYLKNSTYNNWDWKYLFLKYPEAISYCNQGFIKWYSENDIRLLPKTNVGGNHAELRSYCFFLENKISDNQINPSFSPFEKIGYFFQQNSDAHPGCSLTSLKIADKYYRLDIRYSKGGEKYEFCFYHEVVIEDRKIDHQIVEILENQNFLFNNVYNHYHRQVRYSEANKEIENLCQVLKKN